MSSWRPIETAPKDGTDVLLNREGYFKVGSWCYDEGEPARTVWECGGFLLHDPTHWMPIPKPPRARAAKSKPAAKTNPKTRGWRKMSTAPLGTPIEVRFAGVGADIRWRTVTATLDEHGFWIGKTYWARFTTFGHDRLDDWRPLSK